MEIIVSAVYERDNRWRHFRNPKNLMCEKSIDIRCISQSNTTGYRMYILVPNFRHVLPKIVPQATREIMSLVMPVNSPHKRPVTRKLFPFDDVIMFAGEMCHTHLWLPMTSEEVLLKSCNSNWPCQIPHHFNSFDTGTGFLFIESVFSQWQSFAACQCNFSWDQEMII